MSDYISYMNMRQSSYDATNPQVKIPKKVDAQVSVVTIHFAYLILAFFGENVLTNLITVGTVLLLP